MGKLGWKSRTKSGWNAVKVLNKNNMSINQKVKIESNRGLGQDLSFSIFGCKSAKMAITFRGPKNERCLGQLPKFSKNDFKIAHFCCSCHFLDNHFQYSKFLKNAKFSFPFHMIYGKKRPRFIVYPLFGFLLHETFYMTLVATDGSSTKCSVIF